MFVRWNSLQVLIAMIAVVFVGISLPGCNQQVGNAKDAPVNATATKVTRQFEVEGMHCDRCATIHCDSPASRSWDKVSHGLVRVQERPRL